MTIHDHDVSADMICSHGDLVCRVVIVVLPGAPRLYHAPRTASTSAGADPWLSNGHGRAPVDGTASARANLRPEHPCGGKGLRCHLPGACGVDRCAGGRGAEVQAGEPVGPARNGAGAGDPRFRQRVPQAAARRVLSEARRGAGPAARRVLAVRRGSGAWGGGEAALEVAEPEAAAVTLAIEVRPRLRSDCASACLGAQQLVVPTCFCYSSRGAFVSLSVRWVLCAGSGRGRLPAGGLRRDDQRPRGAPTQPPTPCTLLQCFWLLSSRCWRCWLRNREVYGRLKALAVVGAGRLGLTGCVLTVRWSLRCAAAGGAVWVRRLTAAPTTRTTGDRQLFLPCL